MHYRKVGDGETVSAQIPEPGQVVSGGSEIIIYFGEEPEERTVEVPNLIGMTRQQASDTAGALGLYILVTGNTSVDPKVKVTTQSVPAGTQVRVGTTITLEFIDSGTTQ